MKIAPRPGPSGPLTFRSTIRPTGWARIGRAPKSAPAVPTNLADIPLPAGLEGYEVRIVHGLDKWKTRDHGVPKEYRDASPKT